MAETVTSAELFGNSNVVSSEELFGPSHVRKPSGVTRSFETGIVPAFKYGLQASIPGMLARKGLPEPWQPEGRIERLAHQAGALIPELPIYMAGGLLGAGGGPITAAGSSFASVAGIRKVLMDKYVKGEVKSSSEFLGRLGGALKETGKGYATGMAVGGVGKVASLIPRVGKYAKFPAEIATMTTVPAALEGRIPEPQDFQDAFLLLGALRVGMATPAKLRKIYVRYGKPPMEVAKEYEQGILDPRIKKELDTKEITPPAKKVIPEIITTEELLGKPKPIIEPEVKPTPIEEVKVQSVATSGGKQSLIEEARKYKSAEEFVEAQGEPVYRGVNTERKVFVRKSTPELERYEKQRHEIWSDYNKKTEPLFKEQDAAEKRGDNDTVMKMRRAVDPLVAERESRMKALGESPASGEYVREKISSAYEYDRNALGYNTLDNATNAWHGGTSLFGFAANTEKVGTYNTHRALRYDIKNPLEFESVYDAAMFIKENIENRHNKKYKTTTEISDLADDKIDIRKEMGRIVKKLQKDGYDGIKINNDAEFGGTTYFAFDKKQIKDMPTKADLTSIWNKAQEGKGTAENLTQRAARVRKETEVKFAEEAASTETITEREMRRKQQVKGLFAETQNANATLQLMRDVVKQGGFNRDSLVKAYGKDTANEIAGTRTNLVKKDGGILIDKYAQDKGIDTETLKNNLLDYKKTSITKAKEVQYLKERYNAELKAAKIEPRRVEESSGDLRASLEAQGYSSRDIETALKELAEERATIQGEGKGDVQPNLAGLSPEETFTLNNPTTEISKPLSKQVTPKNAELPGATLYSGLDITKIVPTVKTLWEKPVIQELVDAYKRPPEITEVKTIIGKYTGALQMIDHELSKVGKDINAKIPKDRQEAITRYMQAGGDEALLGERASQSKTVYKKHHEAAAKLTPEEKQSATDIRKRLDDVWQKANEAGILDDYVENYVRGEWVKPNDAGKKLISHVSSGTFLTNPHEAMHKVFQNYFDGEQLGYKPTDSTIGYQLIAAERSLRNAIEARKALKSLMGSKEKDGRPTVSVGGAGNPLPKDSVTGRESYFVNPNIKGKETGDYRFLDHPSMRKWKWIDKDEAGKPIFIQGNMWIHPDAYGRINALLGRSKIREYAVPVGVPIIGGTHPGAAMLQAGAFVKGTILLGPFHQFHVAEHAVFHKVNPFNCREIDFETRPILKEGVEHGLQLVSHNALQDFGEGLATGGLLHKIPITGDYLKQYQEWLFQGFIPKLKAEMFEHAVNRAEKYYAKELASGKFTRDQLLDNAAKQGNAAFGEMNYKYIGRNPTLQDAFRIVGLAPDFLEARLKFAGQALRPKGKEQAMALIRGAVIMGTAAQVLNVMIGDDHKPHWDRPFSLVVGGREYTPRSVVGDIMHLAADPRNFAYQRLNPLWGKPVIEMASGKDRFGRTVDAEDMAKDILKSWIPIPAQGLVKDSKDTFLKSITNTLFQSIGLSNYEYRTNFEKALMETHSKKMIYTTSKEDRDKYKLVSKYSNEIKNAIKSGEQVSQSVKNSFKEDLKSQKLYVEDIKKIVKSVTEDKIAHQLESGFLGVEDIIPIWNKASDEEKTKYLPIIAKKLVSLANNHPQKFQKMTPEIKRTFAVNQ